MQFIDFKARRRSRSLGLIFPGWIEGEKVAFLSPHDDDAVLGAGYLILAAVRSGGIPHLFIFCRGDAGYSSLQEKAGIVKRRKMEAALSYGILGVKKRNIHFFDVPDFSLMTRLDRRLPRGKGLFEPLVSALRQARISRVVFSSGHFEHWDHTAVFQAGVYTSPQAQDPILVDLGRPRPIKSFLAYSVWGDFRPAETGNSAIRADRGIIASIEDEEKVLTAIRAFSSQNQIIENIVAQRSRRKSGAGFLELYQSVGVREPTNYAPYLQVLKKIK